MRIYQLIKIDDNDGYFETQVLVQIFSELDNLKRYVRDFYNLDNCDFYNEIDEYSDDYPQYLYGNHYVAVTHFNV